VLKTYKMFENDQKSGEIITSYIVGMPSGEIIDINDKELTKLKGAHLIKYNKDKKYFIFQDANYAEVKKTLQNPQTVQLIHNFMDHYGISRYKVNEDFSVDVFGDVNLSLKNLVKIPVKFRKVSGYFDCSANKLTNLVNAPDEILNYFDCTVNNIYTLIGGPRYVEGGYYCMDNKLEDLVGYPKYCLTVFDASRNELKTLKGTPETIKARFFNVSHNKLHVLSHGPRKTMNFDCSNNQIHTLSNGVREVDGNFNCSNNRLTNLMGMPSCDKIIYDGNEIEEIEYD
jgi:hypothetical protein